METKTRTLVKTLIYRCWVLLSTYTLLVVTGQSLDEALVPTIIINCIWMTSYFMYERFWAHIEWGRKN
jgi:hypothetical protein